MSETSALEQPQHPQDGEKRCDFLYLATAAVGAVGTAIAVWPLIDSMKPSADVLALATVEVDLEPVQVG
jgi:ubiquinol-cytochrome c reductase iron-sulfur subunit